MDEKIPSIGISYQVQTRPSRTIVLQAFVERDCEAATLNALLDKLRDAAERQQVREKIDDVRLEIKNAKHRAVQQQAEIEKADAQIIRNWENGNRRGEPRPTQQESQRQQQAYDSAENLKHQISVLSEDLAKFEAIVG
jgi:hypothetical protein